MNEVTQKTEQTMSTRELVLASFRRAILIADRTGSYVGNAASVAGQYLQLAQGNPTRAVLMLPTCDGVFWARVASHLTAIASEDRDVTPAPPPAPSSDDLDDTDPIDPK